MNAMGDPTMVDWLMLLGANVLAQILLIVLLAWALGRTAARHDPVTRHGVWLCALVCVLLSPLTAWVMDFAGVTLIAIPVAGVKSAPQLVESAAPVAAAIPEPGGHSFAGPLLREGPSHATFPPERMPIVAGDDESRKGQAASVDSLGQGSPVPWGRVLMTIAGTLWAAGSMFLIGRVLHGYLAIRRLQRGLCWAIPSSLGEIRDEACNTLEVDRLPPIALTSAGVGPLTLGVLRPVIVLPEDLMQRLDRRQLRDVLIHEFAHAIRRDTLVGLLQRLAAALFWPHPLIYLLNRELAQAREELCDNFVLRQSDGPDYAQTLVLIAENVMPSRRLAMVALLEQRGQLERRVAGLLDEKRKTSTRLHRGVAVILGSGFVAAAVLVAGTRLLEAQPPAGSVAPAAPQAAEVREPLVLDLSPFLPPNISTPKRLQPFLGRHVIDGLPFEVAGQAQLFGRTPASRGQNFPDTLQGIRVGRTFDELHLIHHTHWPDVRGETVAYLSLNYADGTKSILPIRYGRHVLDLDYLPSYQQEAPTDPDTKVCWREAAFHYKAPARYFKTRLLNPSPAKVVETIDVVSARHLSTYSLLAATVADRDPARPITPTLPANQPDWKFDSQVTIEVVDAVTRKPIEGALVEVSIDVLKQWVVGPPFYTSEDGKGPIRYPREDTRRIAVSAAKEGYSPEYQSWQNRYPETFALELTPLDAPASARKRSLIGDLETWLSSSRSTPQAAADPPAIRQLFGKAVAKPSSVHVVAKMRTLPNDNFSLIDADHDFVTLEIWRQFGEKPKWRVEKPGRTAAMDGDSTAMLIAPNIGVKFPQPSPGAFDSRVLIDLGDAEGLITGQLRKAQAKGWPFSANSTRTAAGDDKFVVTIQQKAEVPDDDPQKNKWLGSDSDLRWEYRGDSKTQRLEDAEVYLHRPQGDVLVLKVERVEYDTAIDPAVFSLKFPDNTQWYKEPERVADNEKYEKMSPQESARTFFEACGREDWKEVENFFQPLNDRIKTYLGGLQVIALGEPFRSQSYAGWFVPYEIKLKDGSVKKWNLAVRNDNPAHRYVVDGGL
jgi:beta-lactamase regulating signal transducer with metallopeptidase domain